MTQNNTRGEKRGGRTMIVRFRLPGGKVSAIKTVENRKKKLRRESRW